MKVRKTDTKTAIQVLSDPELYALISDDSSPGLEEFARLAVGALEQPDVEVVEVRHDDELGGVVIFEQADNFTWKIHVNMLPSFCGEGRGYKATVAAIDWAWTNLPACDALVAVIPTDPGSEKAFRLSKKLGFRELYRTEGTVQKNGRLFDEVVSELRRDEYYGLGQR